MRKRFWRVYFPLKVIVLLKTNFFAVGYSVSLKEWEGVEKSVDKDTVQRINECEEICKKLNVRNRTFSATREMLEKPLLLLLKL